MPETAVDNSNILYEAANLYYEHQFSQQMIANRLGISRPGVSRMLQKARDEGIVRIQVIDPSQKGTHLESTLMKRYNLQKVIVVPGQLDESAQIPYQMGLAVGRYLSEICQDGSTLAISWGSTMQTVSQALTPLASRNMAVVQLNGGVSGAQYDTHAAEIVHRIGVRWQAIPFLLQLPAVVDTAIVKETIISDRNIAKTLQLAISAKIALFTIGSFNENSALVKAEYLQKSDVEFLSDNGAVGDICSRIFNSDGEIVSTELDARTIGLDLHQIAAKPHAIAVAGGNRKIKAISGALKGRLFNVLITDEWTANCLADQQVTL